MIDRVYQVQIPLFLDNPSLSSGPVSACKKLALCAVGADSSAIQFILQHKTTQKKPRKPTKPERVQVITDRTAAEQSMNSWECGCTDINIAAAMQGIKEEELRDGTAPSNQEKPGS